MLEAEKMGNLVFKARWCYHSNLFRERKDVDQYMRKTMSNKEYIDTNYKASDHPSKVVIFAQWSGTRGIHLWRIIKIIARYVSVVFKIYESDN